MITTRGPQDQQGDGDGEHDATAVEESLRSLRWEVSPAVDAEVMAAAGPALDASAAAAAAAAARREGGRQWWRGGRPRAFAAALLVSAAAVAVWGVFFAGPSFTLADVVRAVGQQHKWVHLRYEGGSEVWYSLADGTEYARAGGSASVVEPGGRQLVYWSPAKYLMEVNKSSPVARGAGDGDGAPGDHGKQAWARIVSPLDDGAGRNDRRREVERVTDTLTDHGKVARFDTYQNDSPGKRELIAQLWADPQTRLPIRTRHRLPPTRGAPGRATEVQREWNVGDFSFPEKGPAGLADLGVPKDLPVLSYDTVPADVQAVLRASERAAARFPKQYRAVYRGATKDSGAVGPLVMWRDDERMRIDAYANLDPQAAGALPLPATEAQVLAWAAKQTPQDVQLSDGRTLFRKLEPGRGKAPFAHVVNDQTASFTAGRFPHHDQWMQVVSFAASRRLPPGASAEERQVSQGCVGFRTEAGAHASEFWVDPEHDYLLIRRVQFARMGDGPWRRTHVGTFGDLAQLPGGQWYGRTYTETEFPPPGAPDEAQVVRIYQIDVTPLKPGEFPKGLFDGAALTKDVKVLIN